MLRLESLLRDLIEGRVRGRPHDVGIKCTC